MSSKHLSSRSRRSRRNHHKKTRRLNADLYESDDETEHNLRQRSVLSPDSQWKELCYRRYLRMRMRRGLQNKNVVYVDGEGRPVSLAERIVRFKLKQSEDKLIGGMGQEPVQDESVQRASLHSLLHQYRALRESEAAIGTQLLGEIGQATDSLKKDGYLQGPNSDTETRNRRGSLAISLGDSATHFNVKNVNPVSESFPSGQENRSSTAISPETDKLGVSNVDARRPTSIVLNSDGKTEGDAGISMDEWQQEQVDGGKQTAAPGENEKNHGQSVNFEQESNKKSESPKVPEPEARSEKSSHSLKAQNSPQQTDRGDDEVQSRELEEGRLKIETANVSTAHSGKLTDGKKSTSHSTSFLQSPCASGQNSAPATGTAGTGMDVESTPNDPVSQKQNVSEQSSCEKNSHTGELDGPRAVTNASVEDPADPKLGTKTMEEASHYLRICKFIGCSMERSYSFPELVSRELYTISSSNSKFAGNTSQFLCLPSLPAQKSTHVPNRGPSIKDKSLLVTGSNRQGEQSPPNKNLIGEEDKSQPGDFRLPPINEKMPPENTSYSHIPSSSTHGSLPHAPRPPSENRQVDGRSSVVHIPPVHTHDFRGMSRADTRQESLERYKRIIGLYDELRSFNAFHPGSTDVSITMSCRKAHADMHVEWGYVSPEKTFSSLKHLKHRPSQSKRPSHEEVSRVSVYGMDDASELPNNCAKESDISPQVDESQNGSKIGEKCKTKAHDFLYLREISLARFVQRENPPYTIRHILGPLPENSTATDDVNGKPSNHKKLGRYHRAMPQRTVIPHTKSRKPALHKRHLTCFGLNARWAQTDCNIIESPYPKSSNPVMSTRKAGISGKTSIRQSMKSIF
ncbi:uncharacterized protein LOC106011309 [Aplysia californica]|uniref:Uncharacterized protein LOC106011309 n=1 Tax=Aplysia californica TaxID=6500 RepID=A0ABM0ZWF5_APLCA|nr:uncharacterized protein LOC106011309 [Aplysia californica]